MSTRRRRHAVEEHENHERWLVSYADFITLLFAFFVVMYAISSVNEGKYRVLSDALDAAFRDRPMSDEPIQVGKPVQSMGRPDPGVVAPEPEAAVLDGAVTELEEAALDSPAALEVADETAAAQSQPQSNEAIAERLRAALQASIDARLVEVRTTADRVEVEMKSHVLFGSGSARLQVAAVPLLTEFAGALAGFSNPIQVEGFTDDQPIATVAFPSNWELSAARSASVVHLFAELGIRPDRMAAVGYGEFRPVADNTTADGRQRNRRVVVAIPGGVSSGDLTTGRQTVVQTSTAVPARSGASPSRPAFQRVAEFPGQEPPRL